MVSYAVKQSMRRLLRDRSGSRRKLSLRLWMLRPCPRRLALTIRRWRRVDRHELTRPPRRIAAVVALVIVDGRTPKSPSSRSLARADGAHARFSLGDPNA